MNIDRDDSEERQARIDWMISEFREAQARRYAKRRDRTVTSQPDATLQPPVTESATPR